MAELMGAHTVKFNRIKKRERKIPKPNLELVIFPKTLKFKIKFQISNFI